MIQQHHFRGWVRGFMGFTVVLSATAQAQYDSRNISLYKQFTLADFGNPGNGNSCWGYVSPSGREYAIMGLSNRVAFVEITDPANARIIATVAHSNSLWADIKVYQHYCYVVNESGGGIQVIDMSNIDNGSVSLVRSVASPSTSHTVAVNTASGYLYPTGSNTDNGGLLIFSLADPSNPVKVNAWNTRYVHEAHVVTYTSGPYAGREIAFLFCGGAGLYIVDVTNKSSLIQLSQRSYPCLSYCHQGWTTDDRRYLFINDELDEIYGCRNQTTTYVFDISDLSNPVLATTFSNGINVPDHNLYVDGNLLFESNYGTGLRIWNISDLFAPVELGYFDTYPGSNPLDFVGNWSNYPYFPSGTTIVSDIERGLFILDVSAVRRGLKFTFPGGLPNQVNPRGGTRVRFEVSALGSQPQPGTGRFLVNTGSGFVDGVVEPIRDHVYDAVFPSSTCGSNVRFYFAAVDDSGRTYTSPPDAPNNSYSALSAGQTLTVLADNFELDHGWTVVNENVSDGAWARGVPVNDGRGGPTTDYDGSGRCYTTGLGANQDLDGGPTRLLSPILDLSTGTAFIQYAVLFYNDDNDADRLVVELSNNGGTNWTLVESLSNTGTWVSRSLRVADHVTPTAQVRMRFSASDNPNNSVTEAGVDAFHAFVVTCDGLTCSDVKKLNAKCKSNGKIVAKVVMFNESFSGQTVAITVDDVEHVLTISGRSATHKECCRSGVHTVTLTDPSGCGLSKVVSCP